MRVGVVAAEAEGRRTGVGRYLEGLMSGLAAWPHGAEWRLLTRGPLPAGAWSPVSGATVQPVPSTLSATLWEQLVLPRQLHRQRVDVVFSPGYSVPLAAGIPSVVAVHDLSFELLGEEFRWRERWRRRVLARLAVRRARRVVVDTEAMAATMADVYGLPASHLAVVPLGVDAGRFTPEHDPADTELDRLGICSPYLLAVGAVLTRRHPRLLLEALAVLRQRHGGLRLVLAGPDRLRERGALDRWVEQLGLGGAVVRLGWVEERWLPALYRGAVATVYLSDHEGFGLPPLESLACGTPVVITPGQGLDELWPSYPLVVSAERETVVAAVERVLAGDRPSALALRAGVAAATWEATARGLVEVLREVAGR